MLCQNLISRHIVLFTRGKIEGFKLTVKLFMRTIKTPSGDFFGPEYARLPAVSDFRVDGLGFGPHPLSLTHYMI